MSFWPLARRIAEDLADAAIRGPVVDLGAGDGGLSRRLLQRGIRLLLCDRRYPPAPAGSAALAADARRLPFPDACLAGVVAGNLLRQIDPVGRGEVAREVRRCLAPGGRVVILEDEPRARGRAERNYRDCLRLLAQVDSGRGQALLSLEEAGTFLRPWLGEVREQGRVRNVEKVRDALSPLRWMEARAQDPALRARVETLRRRVEEDGMDYGRYWYQIYGEDAR